MFPQLVGFGPQLLIGTWVTIKLALCALSFGLVVGMLFCIAKLSPFKWLRWPVNIFVDLIRGLPELLVLFFIYFGGTFVLTKLFGQYIEVGSFVSGVIALGLIFASYASETLRGAYHAVPTGQREAAIALGMNKKQQFFHIILPQMWHHALPGIANLWFVLIKDTALVSLVGITDLMGVAQQATAYTKQAFTFYLAAALIYLLLTSLSLMGQKLMIKHRLQY